MSEIIEENGISYFKTTSGKLYEVTNKNWIENMKKFYDKNNPKEFSCCDGHQFNSDEVKEWLGERASCPFCWPNGFRNK